MSRSNSDRCDYNIGKYHEMPEQVSQGLSSSMIISRSSPSSRIPLEAAKDLMTPLTGDCTTISIFIALSTTRAAPFSTWSPSATRISITEPGIGAPTSPPSLSLIKTDRSCPFISKNTSRSPFGVRSSAIARVLMPKVFPLAIVTCQENHRSKVITELEELLSHCRIQSRAHHITFRYVWMTCLQIRFQSTEIKRG
ncbi:hypothetical protein B566_EDAN010338 [Ephemera danica]|nr:hypothetical protein B566_EDAN010338 [Ephemera danica]